MRPQASRQPFSMEGMRFPGRAFGDDPAMLAIGGTVPDTLDDRMVATR
jgi:hypothetical protein